MNVRRRQGEYCAVINAQNETNRSICGCRNRTKLQICTDVVPAGSCNNYTLRFRSASRADARQLWRMKKFVGSKTCCKMCSFCRPLPVPSSVAAHTRRAGGNKCIFVTDNLTSRWKLAAAALAMRQCLCSAAPSTVACTDSGSGRAPTPRDTPERMLPA